MWDKCVILIRVFRVVYIYWISYSLLSHSRRYRGVTTEPISRYFEFTLHRTIPQNRHNYYERGWGPNGNALHLFWFKIHEFIIFGYVPIAFSLATLQIEITLIHGFWLPWLKSHYGPTLSFNAESESSFVCMLIYLAGYSDYIIGRHKHTHRIVRHSWLLFNYYFRNKLMPFAWVH